MKVAICWDRFLSVYFRHWKNVYFKKPRPLILTVSLIAFFVALNFQVLITYGYVETIGNVSTAYCYETSGGHWMTIWGQVKKPVWPFFLLLNINIKYFSTNHNTLKGSLGYLFGCSFFDDFNFKFAFDLYVI
jgi:hypothetical protein